MIYEYGNCMHTGSIPYTFLSSLNSQKQIGQINLYFVGLLKLFFFKLLFTCILCFVGYDMNMSLKYVHTFFFYQIYS